MVGLGEAVCCGCMFRLLRMKCSKGTVSFLESSTRTRFNEAGDRRCIGQVGGRSFHD